MLQKSKILIALSVVVFSMNAWAQRGKRQEHKSSSYQSTSSSESSSYSDSVLPTFDNTIELDLKSSSVSFTSATGGSSFDLSLSAYYFYSAQIEIGGAVGFTSVSGTNHMGLYALGLYNFDTYLKKSYFAGGGLGFADAGFAGGGTGTDKKMSIVAFAGKRFPLWDRLLLSPIVRFEKIADVDPIFSIIPFNVSIVL